jgi:hypothetical protein
MKYSGKLVSLSLACIGAILAASSCKEKKSDESELITTVKMTITNGGIPVGTFQWKDTDGAGGYPPLPTDTIALDSGITYIASIAFLNESNGGSEDLTTEVKNEASNHLVCYTPAAGILQVTITDNDGKFPLGLQSEWKTNSKGNSTVRVVLRHQPGIKDGTCDPGETDVDVSFPIVIK